MIKSVFILKPPCSVVFTGFKQKQKNPLYSVVDRIVNHMFIFLDRKYLAIVFLPSIPFPFYSFRLVSFLLP